MISDSTVKLYPSKLNGSIAAPPSKSQTLRAILFASLASGTSKVYRYLNSPDTTAMIKACEQLGASINISDDMLTIKGVNKQLKQPSSPIDVGNSGIVFRFIAAICALLPEPVFITGDHSIRTNRPIQALLDGLTGLGAQAFSLKANKRAPISVKGPLTQGGTTSLDGSDSQPVSALFILASLLEGTSHIHVTNPGEIPWVGLTCHWLKRLGVPYQKHSDSHYSITGVSGFSAFEYTVPGDFSSIAFPLIAAIITNSSIDITHLDHSDPQGDRAIIQALQQMGARIDCDSTSILVRPSPTLHATTIDMNTMIDAIPALAVVACFAEGQTQLTNAAIARQKECDRLSTMQEKISALSGNIIATNDSLIIQGSPLKSVPLHASHDHRIGMALAAAALGMKEPTTIHNIRCINKTYPNFFDDLKKLGAKIEMFA